MGSTFTGAVESEATTYIVDHPFPPPLEEDEWMPEIEALERAVDVLLDLKRAVLRGDPVRETTLWYRHVDVLRDIKRKMDAICL